MNIVTFCLLAGSLSSSALLLLFVADMCVPQATFSSRLQIQNMLPLLDGEASSLSRHLSLSTRKPAALYCFTIKTRLPWSEPRLAADVEVKIKKNVNLAGWADRGAQNGNKTS